MINSSPLIAIIGPSGVGKGFLGDKIREIAPEVAVPSIYTTRLQRPSEKPSEARKFVGDSVFSALEMAELIVLSHRPFRRSDSPRYGFEKKSLLDPTRTALTEVHSTILKPFRSTVIHRPVLMIALTANKSVLRENIAERQGTFDDGVSDAERVLSAEQETEEIVTAYDAGVVDHIFEYDRSISDELTPRIVNIVDDFIGRHK